MDPFEIVIKILIFHSTSLFIIYDQTIKYSLMIKHKITIILTKLTNEQKNQVKSGAYQPYHQNDST